MDAAIRSSQRIISLMTELYNFSLYFHNDEGYYSDGLSKMRLYDCVCNESREYL